MTAKQDHLQELRKAKSFLSDQKPSYWEKEFDFLGKIYEFMFSKRNKAELQGLNTGKPVKEYEFHSLLYECRDLFLYNCYDTIQWTQGKGSDSPRFGYTLFVSHQYMHKK